MRPAVCCAMLLAGSLSLTAQGLTRTLMLTQPRMNGADVLEFQKSLLSLGFSGLGTADGWYGPNTEKAVKQTQGLLGILKNGAVNNDFWTLLFSPDQTSTSLRDTLQSVNTFEKLVLARFKETPRVYNYVSGPNYSVSRYSLSEDQSDTAFLYQKFVPIHLDELGYFVYREISTPSGDYFIAQQDYYRPDGSLFLITWDMNTSYADEPATVEKRFYFDPTGNSIRKTVRVYKMNTDLPLNPNFGDRDVDIVQQIKDVPYRSLLKW